MGADTKLSDLEHQVALLYGRGLGIADIGAQLRKSRETIGAMVSALCQFNRQRAAAVARAGHRAPVAAVVAAPVFTPSPAQRNRASNSPLTVRETEIMRRIAVGDSVRLIGEQMDLKPQTIKTAVSRLYHRLGVTTKADAIATCTRLGLLGVLPTANGPSSDPDAQRLPSHGQRGDLR